MSLFERGGDRLMHCVKLKEINLHLPVRLFGASWESVCIDLEWRRAILSPKMGTGCRW